MLFRVKKNNQPELIVGADSNEHLEVTVLLADEDTSPIIEGRAYIFEGNEFTEYHSWDIGHLAEGEKVTIETISNGESTKPSKVEFSTNYRHKYTSGTREYIKDGTEKTKIRTKRLKERMKNKNKVIQCSFCNMIEGEVKAIMPHNDAAICSECIETFSELLRDENA